MIGIVDYDVCNVGSIMNMFKRVGAQSGLVSTEAEVAAAKALVLPGVGSFDAGMSCLRERGLVDVLHRKAVIERVPVLGICLGAQLMTKGSEEGRLPGLEFFDATVKKFRFDDTRLKIPHVGWNAVVPLRTDSLFSGFEATPRFYFVHSFFIECANERDVLARTDYGGMFTSAIQRGNIAAVQFHPEKSHKFGMQLLASFAKTVASK